MKGKIDKASLWIMRGGEFKRQMCPFVQDSGLEFPPQPCGGWCPLFGEPIHSSFPSPGVVSLEICGGKTLRFDEFTDEREGASK